ncbi:MAG: GNAT family N-acetyltransferase [Chloroflexi bacterium]|nr:GNAT family N-acetyltransferase [Chloroflexota bacterium]
MNITFRDAQSGPELTRFITFPWKIYRGDHFWVPPLISSRRDQLNPEKNPFWKANERGLWTAYRGSELVGTIGAFYPRMNDPDGIGTFGFFEVVDDPKCAAALLETAANWLRACGAKVMRGPYNPSTSDECGVLVEGFNTRPAILTAHTPPYYPRLLDAAGFSMQNQMVARLYSIPNGLRRVEEGLPPRLLKIAETAAERDDLKVRRVDMAKWEQEIETAWQLYNASLAPLPGYVPIPIDEFRVMAASFRLILDPDMALLAEVRGRPVGFALALPDYNEALQAANGKLFPLGLVRLWLRSRHLRRSSFKILVIHPEYQGRGVEAVLIRSVGQAILDRGFRELDLSLTGDENVKSNRFQEHLGVKVYRRYRIYQKEV